MPARLRQLASPFSRYWHILTEVPGWPDAPFRRRLLRFIPIVLPLVIAGAVLIWRFALQAPEHRRLLGAYSPLLGLEAEVRDLRASAGAAPEVPDTAHASTLLKSADEASALLARLREAIAAQDWLFSFQIGEPSEPAPETPLLQTLPVRAKLTPAVASPESFNQLLGVLALFSQQSKRLDLMRLTLRADDKGKLQADLQLRLTLIIPPATAASAALPESSATP